MKERLTALLFLFLIAIVGFGIGMFATRSCIPSELCQFGLGNVNDSDYIDMAKETPEVKVFLQHYPNAAAMVNRKENLTVDFIASLGSGGQNQTWPTNMVKLSVFFNKTNNWADKWRIEYSEKKEFGNEGEITKYLDLRKCIETQ